ncbi:MAG: pyridoxamine 5'-phosphate oxidase [Mangrovicoccus sp.]|nr:pyridoxamine 5'-phosphate oxidase [Mangrovicoccus sp.]
MTMREGIFAGDDPFQIMRDWMEEAAKTEPNDPNAMTLATVDGSGLPNARIMLLKEIDSAGIVFFTNYESQKGAELADSAKAGFLIHWKSLRRQIRGRGRVEKTTPEQSDAYYQSRPIDSRLGAWASAQSQPLESREKLMTRVEEMREKYGENPPRPPHWGGFRIVPSYIEFWSDGPYRLHDRFRWSREETEKVWSIERLYP